MAKRRHFERVCFCVAMIDEFGEEIPFEALDGCCQKEVLMNRRNKEVKAQLRVGDRSYARFDAQQSVFTIKRSCACCTDSKDYPLLAKVRQERSLLCGDCTAGAEPEQEEEEDSDSDDDLLLDDFVSPEEEERKAAFLEFQHKLEVAKQYGMASHLEDSLDHVAADVSAGIDTVLHVFNSNDVLCAKLDLYLEDVAPKYIGTKFRRVRFDRGMGGDSRLASFGVKGGDLSDEGTLLCFRSKTLCAASRIDAFADGSTLLNEEVFKYLDNCRVLSTDLPLDRLLLSGRLQANTAEEDEDAGVESFCDDPDCTKRYAHEHVGRGQAGGPVSFLLDDRARGMEALGAGSLQRL